jgi:DeoD family purine-nucleoside phosphorylase
VPGTIHLQPTAPLAERVLLPGDPGRALHLAQSILTEPKMFNHNRGLWGYTGKAADGELLTIQSTGMGGPSAAIVISELYELGARMLLRVGTCGAIDPTLELGELIVASEALSADGTSQVLGAGTRTTSSASMLERLTSAAGPESRVGPIVTTDIFYEEREGIERSWLSDGALAVEMEAATLFALAERRGFDAGAILIVSDVIIPERRRIDPESLRSAEIRLGEIAARALAA